MIGMKLMMNKIMISCTRAAFQNLKKPFLCQQTRELRSIPRKPIKVNYSRHSNNVKPVDEYIEDHKITIQPVNKFVQDLSEEFWEDSLEDFEDKGSSGIHKERKKQSKQVSPESTKDKEENDDSKCTSSFKYLKYKVPTSKDFHAIVDCKEKKGIEKKQIFLEGKHLIRDALQAGLVAKYIFFSRNSDLLDIVPDQYAGYKDPILALNNLPLYRTFYTKMKIWSNLVTSPGIMGIFDMPDKNPNLENTNLLPVTVILDGIREHGNLGSIIRTLACTGIKSILVMEGCCDTWNAKTLRSSSGGHFNVKIVDKVKWSHILKYINASEEVYLADICRPEIKMSTDISDIRPFQVYHKRNDSISSEHIDTLYEALEDNSENEVIEFDENGTEVPVNLSYTYSEHLEKYSNAQQPLALYNTINYFDDDKDDIVLVINGEFGRSNSVKKFCFDNQAYELCLNTNNDQSLTTSVALAILVYEIKRQHMQLYKDLRTDTNK